MKRKTFLPAAMVIVLILTSMLPLGRPIPSAAASLPPISNSTSVAFLSRPDYPPPILMTEALSEAAIEGQTYTDPLYGYRLKLPLGWHVRPTPADALFGVAMLYSYDPEEAEQSGRFPTDGVRAQIGVGPLPQGLSLQEWVAQRMVHETTSEDAIAVGLMASEPQPIQIGQHAGLAFILQGNGGPAVLEIDLAAGGGQVMSIGLQPADSTRLEDALTVLATLETAAPGALPAQHPSDGDEQAIPENGVAQSQTLVSSLLSSLRSPGPDDFTCPVGTFPGDEAPTSPIELWMPFLAGETWTVGGAGSFYGNWYHCNYYNDYYATDWNRDGDYGAATLPVANGNITSAATPPCPYTPLGCYVQVDHSSGVRTLYAHLSAVYRSSGSVNHWEQIGAVGCTGYGCQGDHLHLTFKRDEGGYFSHCYNNGSVCPNGEQGTWPQSPKPSPMNTTGGPQILQDGYSYTSNNEPPGGGCAAPSLVSPPDGHISPDRTMTFQWNQPPNCTPDGYTFRVKTVPDMDSGGSTVFDEGVGGTQVTKAFDPQWDNTDLYWSVRACLPCDPYTPGPWAPSRHFRIEPGGGQYPVSLWEHAGYSGSGLLFPQVDYGWWNLTDYDFNDIASSIQIEAGWSARLWLDINLQPANCYKCFISSDSDFGDDYFEGGCGANLNDQASSIEVFYNTGCSIPCSPPSAPGLSTPTNGAKLYPEDELVFQWNGSASEYQVHWWGGPGGDHYSDWMASTTWNVGQQWESPNKYYWQVKGRNGSGCEGDWSSTWEFMIGPQGPSSLSAAAVSYTQIDLSWQDNSTTESDFHLERSLNGSDWQEVSTLSGTSYQDTGLEPGTTYYYRVRAHRHNDDTYSKYSNTVNATTPADTVPPTGRITAPLDGAIIRSCPLTIQAEASDEGSGVDFVEFHAYFDGSWHHLGDDHDAPYGWIWDCSSMSDQGVWLTIHAWDYAGNEAMDPGGYVYVILDRSGFRVYLPCVLHAHYLPSPSPTSTPPATPAYTPTPTATPIHTPTPTSTPIPCGWGKEYTRTDVLLWDIDMLSPDDGWIAGGWCCDPWISTVLHWNGSNWQEVADSGFYQYFTVDMVSSSEGWFGGQFGELDHYSGGSWERVSSPTSVGIRDIEMLSSSEGWAVGGSGYPNNDGAILRFTSGTWQVYASLPNEDLHAIDMVSNSDGWIVGGGGPPDYQGIIYHYDGSSWQQVACPTERWLNDIDMVSSSDGWAVGHGGVILHYLNGFWQTYPSPTTNRLYGIDMLSSTEGWAVGGNGSFGGTILHYQNGAWTEETNPATSFLTDVDMVTSTDGWALEYWEGVLRHSCSLFPMSTTSTAHD